MTACGLDQLEPRPSGFCWARAELPTDVWLFDHFPSHESRRPIVDSLITTYACSALSLFSLLTPHTISVRFIACDRVTCQTRGVQGLQLHPLNLSRLRPSGLVPPSRQQNGLESDS
jgi:hypothetical protein